MCEILMRVQGVVETELLNFQKANPGFKTYLMRPAMIIEREWTLRSTLYGLGPSIIVDNFAECMINLARKGSERAIWENTDMNDRGLWP